MQARPYHPDAAFDPLLCLPVSIITSGIPAADIPGRSIPWPEEMNVLVSTCHADWPQVADTVIEARCLAHTMLIVRSYRRDMPLRIRKPVMPSHRYRSTDLEDPNMLPKIGYCT